MVATSYALGSYALGLGSNRRHGRHGGPEAVLAAAVAALAAAGVEIVARSPVRPTAPVGPGTRRYANAAVVVRSPLPPPALLALAKAIERDFGRRPGRRWGDRVLDIDLLLWSGGIVLAGGARTRRLAVPHPALVGRRFALAPLAAIAPGWRLPRDGRTVRHLAHAVDRRHPRP